MEEDLRTAIAQLTRVSAVSDKKKSSSQVGSQSESAANIVMFHHPSPLQDLIGTPKQKWKHEHHKKRWERRYKKPYPKINGVPIVFNGFAIKNET